MEIKIPLKYKLIMYAIIAVVAFFALLILGSVAAGLAGGQFGASGADGLDSSTAKVCDGIKVITVADDAAANAVAIEYIEKFGLHTMLTIADAYGANLDDGKYYIDNGVLKFGDNTNFVSIDFKSCDSDENNKMLYATGLSPTEVAMWNIFKKYIGNNLATFNLKDYSFDVEDFVVKNYKQIAIITLCAQLGYTDEQIADTLTLASQDYEETVTSLIVGLDYFNFKMQEKEIIAETIAATILGRGPIFSGNWTDGFIYTGNTYDFISSADDLVNELKELILDIFNSVDDDSLMYRLIPKLYIKDYTFQELNDRISDIDSIANERIVSILYMPNQECKMDYFMITLEGLNADTQAGILPIFYSNASGSYTKVIGSEQAFDSGDDYFELEMRDIQEFLSFVINYKLYCGQFINNTPSEEKTLVGFGNDYDKYFEIIDEEDSFSYFYTNHFESIADDNISDMFIIEFEFIGDAAAKWKIVASID